jgi:cell division protease FtsH
MRAFRKAGSAYEGDTPHAMSEATARRVDEEIEKILTAGYDRAYDVLNRNRDAVKAIADALLEQEALESDEIRDLLAQADAHL